MIFVYPVGIPPFYFYVLFKKRAHITAVDRDHDPTIQKLSFLWENYEPQMWWWEVFECCRRLALSGVLVFVAQGTPSQILVALLVQGSNTRLWVLKLSSEAQYLPAAHASPPTSPKELRKMTSSKNMFTRTASRGRRRWVLVLVPGGGGKAEGPTRWT